MTYRDVFLETTLGSDTDQSITPYLPEELARLNVANVPPLKLPNGHRFYYTRIGQEHVEAFCSHPALADAVVATSWDELVYQPYRYRDLLLTTIVAREDGGTEGVPLSQLGRPEDSISGKAWPWSVFMGDEVRYRIADLPNAALAAARRKSELQLHLNSIDAAVTASNSVSPGDAATIRGEIEDCRALTAAPTVDRGAVRGRLAGLRDFCSKIGQQAIARLIVDALTWLAQHWHELL